MFLRTAAFETRGPKTLEIATGATTTEHPGRTMHFPGDLHIDLSRNCFVRVRCPGTVVIDWTAMGAQITVDAAASVVVGTFNDCTMFRQILHYKHAGAVVVPEGGGVFVGEV